MRVLVTGATGLLGQYLIPAVDRHARCFPVGRTRLPSHPDAISVDLADRREIARVLDEIRPDAIIHAAALTDVDACEERPRDAYRANVQTTRNLVAWAARREGGCRFVYISTDQVYDGDGPHSEIDADPPNIYGMTKLWAEDLVRTLSRSLVLRTNFVALGPSDRPSGLVAWLVDCLSRGRRITLFEDVLFNPLHAGDLAELIVGFLERETSGIYNLGASDSLSKGEFARRLASRLGLSLAGATSGSVGDVPLRAHRPTDLRMAVTAIEGTLQRRLPTVEDGLRCLEVEWREREGQHAAS